MLPIQLQNVPYCEVAMDKIGEDIQEYKTSDFTHTWCVWQLSGSPYSYTGTTTGVWRLITLITAH